jgi:hypothetical protein
MISLISLRVGRGHSKTPITKPIKTPNKSANAIPIVSSIPESIEIIYLYRPDYCLRYFVTNKSCHFKHVF